MTLKVSDLVKPKPEWNGSDAVPSGRVIKIVRWGTTGAVYLDTDHRACVADCFDVVEELCPS